MNPRDEKGKILANLVNNTCGDFPAMEEALNAIEEVERRQYEELMLGAKYVLNDFNTFGPVLQTDEEGEYSRYTSIGRLRTGFKIVNNQ